MKIRKKRLNAQKIGEARKSPGGGTTKKGDVRKTARRAFEPGANATGRRKNE